MESRLRSDIIALEGGNMRKIQKIEKYRPPEQSRDHERLEIIQTNLDRLITTLNEIVDDINEKNGYEE